MKDYAFGAMIGFMEVQFLFQIHELNSITMINLIIIHGMYIE